MNTEIKGKFQKLFSDVAACFVGRREEVYCALLALLTGEHCCFLGDPGTAKSAVVRQIVKRIYGAIYFFIQLFGETPPSDVFGQSSIRALREEDKNVRNVEGHLPAAHVAFLDEVFDARSTNLVGMNSIMQERQFRNGGETMECPTRTIFGASNTFPDDPELRAFWDRFLIRRHVKPLDSMQSVVEMLIAPDPPEEPTPAVSLSEWDAARDEVQRVRLSMGVAETYVGLVLALANHEETPVRVSNRRQKKAVKVMKAAAYLAGRDEVSASDFSALRHVLWTREADIPVVESMLEQYRPLDTSALEALVAELEGPFADIVEIDRKRDKLKGEGKKDQSRSMSDALRARAPELLQKAEDVLETLNEAAARAAQAEGAREYIERVQQIQEQTAKALAGHVLGNL